MPGTVHVKVVKARDLPIMDKRSELTDAFVEIKLGSGWSKTDVCPKTLNPRWNSQWTKFNVTDEELQDEPLQLKVMDRDLYSAHDAIGRVYIILNPLVESGMPHSSLEGWFPIFDTLHGVRGEIYVQVKLEVIQDQHRFKQSSFGVQFYSCCGEPEGMAIHSIHGFVEELVVNDDPEYQWIDRLRTSRASNEARQRLFSKLSGELRRRIGARALDVDANAILGYKQFFDIEGESGVVVRGIGTCVSLIPKPSNLQVPIPVCLPATMERVRPISTHVDTLMSDDGSLFEPLSLVSPQHSTTAHSSHISPTNTDGLPSSPAKVASKLFIDPVLATATGSGPVVLSTTPPPPIKYITPTSEYPFYTLSSLPDGVLTHIGGLVTARSVKLLDKINNPDDPETRDAWWKEVRDEMKAHLKVMGCTAAIGYTEYTSICDTLCVYSATGTAVTITETIKRQPTSPGSVGDLQGEGDGEARRSSQTESPAKSSSNLGCSLCHLPYSTSKLPFDVNATYCRICRARQVPSVLLSTTDLPDDLLVRGRGCMVQTRVGVPKRKMKGEDNAFKISKELPFLEYHLHSRLLNKVYVCGMNAVFGLRVQVTVGDTVITGLATGTAVYLEALPPPPELSFHGKEGTQAPEAVAALETIQTDVDRALRHNRRTYGLLQPLPEVQVTETGSDAAGVSVDEDTPIDPDLTAGKKDVFLVDISDTKIGGGYVHSIVDRILPDGFFLSNLLCAPGIPVHPQNSKRNHFSPPQSIVGTMKGCGEDITDLMVTIIRKYFFSDQQGSVDVQFSDFLSLLMRELGFKVRNHHPCILSCVTFDIDLPEEEEVQISVTAKVCEMERKRSEVKDADRNIPLDECMFDMEECSEMKHLDLTTGLTTQHLTNLGKVVILSPSTSVTGWCVTQHLGTVNLFLIRESTSLRESGGLSVFIDLFLLEANSILRANVRAMGGNALLNYRLNKCVLIDHTYKNQAQCLLNISGDAVRLKLSSETLPATTTGD